MQIIEWHRLAFNGFFDRSLHPFVSMRSAVTQSVTKNAPLIRPPRCDLSIHLSGISMCFVMRNLIEAFLIVIKSHRELFCISAYSFGVRFRATDVPQVRIAILLNNVEALARVESFISSAFKGMDNCSLIVTV